jgi:hypothetical protein
MSIAGRASFNTFWVGTAIARVWWIVWLVIISYDLFLLLFFLTCYFVWFIILSDLLLFNLTFLISICLTVVASANVKISQITQIAFPCPVCQMLIQVFFFDWSSEATGLECIEEFLFVNFFVFAIFFFFFFFFKFF